MLICPQSIVENDFLLWCEHNQHVFGCLLKQLCPIRETEQFHTIIKKTDQNERTVPECDWLPWIHAACRVVPLLWFHMVVIFYSTDQCTLCSYQLCDYWS